MTKPKKLPKVWVEFTQAGTPMFVTVRKRVGKWSARYAPVEKPKVCKWKLRPNCFGGHNTECGHRLVPRGYGDWCSYCGGEIMVKR